MHTRALVVSISSCALLILCSLTGIGQQKVSVEGRFLDDSLRVGDEIFYALTARYPKEFQILFPDSTFSYAPFEFGKKRFFVTRTENGISFDSAVYHLTTFETDSVQRLRLPVFQINALDCTKYLANWDTVGMRLLVKVAPEKIGPDLPVRATIAYQKVSKQFNFPVILIAAAMSLLLAGVFWVVFGSRVKQYLWARQLRRRHLSFVSSFTSEIDFIRREFSPEKTETALAMWKKYMEGLNRKPYTRLTTRETFQVERDENMVKNLQVLDSAIYGTNTEVVGPLLNLRTIAEKRFDDKLKEVRNG